ncbi:RraA family protein [Lignipirellula cremea]|uniref:Putative 4-hydroxy-4-methyl-2-oxoglutarate aldolase n=1 Tax=Lignipirellula cremea TaxID=2528010 RepID=A0A518DZV0_9BACT|nr:RraA family protein [Lignipirellula cremea]QDU97363.1 4-hydroxy-4-methyl-2-oxoglutarate aldolase [Lignipirellula cremea]
MPISPEMLAQLAKYDTPTICNIIELFDVRPRNRGYMDSRIKCNFPEMKPMVGFAATACFRSDAPPVGGDAYGSIQQQIAQFPDLPGPAIVVFQDLDDPPVAAVFGEVMCTTYQAFGAAGLVTNGAGRDLDQVREIGFPVFTGSTCCAHAYCHSLHIGIPVRVGGLMVNQGDLLHGDVNGVTSIPIDLVPRLLDVADEFVGLEAILLDYVKGEGVKSVDKFSELRVKFQGEVKKLRDRVLSQ